MDLGFHYTECDIPGGSLYDSCATCEISFPTHCGRAPRILSHGVAYHSWFAGLKQSWIELESASVRLTDTFSSSGVQGLPTEAKEVVTASDSSFGG